MRHSRHDGRDDDGRGAGLSLSYGAAAAQDWALPVAALVEALDYSQRFRDVIAADAAEECALSDELTQPHGPLG